MRHALGSLIVAGIATAGASLAGTVSTAHDAPVFTTQAVAVPRVPAPAGGLRDETAMVLVGAALIGLAAAVRRA